MSDFIPLVRRAVPRFAAHPPNPHQQSCIHHPVTDPLMIVAGPGSGKTTVLVLRALRFVFVDGILPENIILTTFTRKAAEELRSRLIEWGLLLIDDLKNHPPAVGGPNFLAWLDSIDVNRFVTGTLDSICEEALTRHRDPADQVPVVVEGFVGNALLRTHGLFPAGARNNPDLAAYLAQFTFDGSPPRNFGETLGVSRTIVDRLLHDEIDIAAFMVGHTHSAARNCIATAAASYWTNLEAQSRLDFARMEYAFHERLRTGRLARFTSGIRVVLVDEYQDTNPLQERIYFAIVQQSNASLTIVGDDDQSLYRFRGATIELFRDFVSNFRQQFPTQPPPVIRYLIENYRSTPEIVDFFNNHIDTDAAFRLARVQPPKPRIQHQLPTNGCPVLGMFRPDRDALADALTDFLLDVFRRNGRPVICNGQQITLVRHPEGGDMGDCVFLSRTVNEYAAAFGAAAPRPRLPLMLRQRLRVHGIDVFNPRGRALRDIEVVQHLLGTILLCIDPANQATQNGAQLDNLIGRNALRREAIQYLTRWRQAATAFVATNPPPNSNHTLRDFVLAWNSRRPQAGMQNWPDEWPILELCFKIISWIPYLRDDPEGQVYLEAVCRVISQAATFSSYRSNLVFDDPGHAERSIQRAITDIFAPMAENETEIDEDIMPSVPRDRLMFMTIHQAKGLEFPLVIVDVGSDYRTNNVRQRFSRFPETPSNVTLMEDDLAPYCAIGNLRLARTALDRTFDDLQRLYYVAYSRPQSVLLLVGLDSCLRYNSTIRHVAIGWSRNAAWNWQRSNAGRPPALANNIPLALI